jgi:hypothetical protein
MGTMNWWRWKGMLATYLIELDGGIVVYVILGLIQRTAILPRVLCQLPIISRGHFLLMISVQLKKRRAAA